MNRKERRRKANLARSTARSGSFTAIRQAALRHVKAGELQQAAGLCEQLLRAQPRDPLTLSLLGAISARQRRYDRANELLSAAVSINPNDAHAHRNLGTSLQAQGKLDGAIASYKRALAIIPDDADVLNNLGNALSAQNKIGAAIACYERALAVNPRDADVHHNLANALGKEDRLEEAIASYQQALEICPDQAETLTSLLHLLQQSCAWDRLDELNARVNRLIRARISENVRLPEAPLANVTRCDDPALNLSVARLRSKSIAERFETSDIRFPISRQRRSNQDRMTVGYLSSDFRVHPTAYLMAGVFRLHSRSDFRIHAYSTGRDDGSELRKQISDHCDSFTDVSKLDPLDAARRIYDDRVDILVDLNGYTQGSRLAISALRPAPVHICYLGFPGAMGADFIDYIITDKVVTPEDQAAFYTEKFAYLPHCYQANDDSQVISERIFTASDFGLPKDTFVFCSFNQSYKIEPVMFGVWMSLLRAVPESILWLWGSNELAERNLRAAAEARGMSPERLIFSDKLPRDEHLARLRLADLVLDTRICNGHTTTSDALWVGVPVVTLRGRHFASRVSSSLLAAIGLTELVTQSLGEYEALALQLARDARALDAIRRKLAKNRRTKPLFDTPRFVTNLENAYKQMFGIFMEGQAPRIIEVPDSEVS